jgi:hypothetical protein
MRCMGRRGAHNGASRGDTAHSSVRDGIACILYSQGREWQWRHDEDEASGRSARRMKFYKGACFTSRVRVTVIMHPSSTCMSCCYAATRSAFSGSFRFIFDE